MNRTIQEWVETEHEGQLKLDNPLDCPVQGWIQQSIKNEYPELADRVRTQM